MSNILYLVHRIPYPPNKGDKIRSFHLLKHLSLENDIYLGTFIDDVQDEKYISDVEHFCKKSYFAKISPIGSKFRSLCGLIYDTPLTLIYYRNKNLQTWINNLVKNNLIDKIVVFSSSMAQYVDFKWNIDVVVDFVDVDSEKWNAYSERYPWPLSFLYRRESNKLLAYERFIALQSKQSFFVTENESNLFKRLAPETASQVSSMNNGVDADYFSNKKKFLFPFDPKYSSISHKFIVFTGAMDYWPNVDAVIWFVAEVLPKLRLGFPDIVFYIVGRNPPSAVVFLASDRIVVTGTVVDVRPYLQYATVVVAPLRIARGIQNKILEAMSMGRPVVASSICAASIDAVPGQELLIADGSDDFCQKVETLLNRPSFAYVLGQAGRENILKNYSWSSHLSAIDSYIQSEYVS